MTPERKKQCEQHCLKKNGKITPELMASANKSLMSADGVLDITRPSGMSYREFKDQERSDRVSAEWNERQRDEINGKSDDAKLWQQTRLEMCEARLANHKGLNGAHLRREVADARAELKAAQVEQVAKVEEEAHQTSLGDNAQFVNAKENSEVQIRMAERIGGEKLTEARLRHRVLDSASEVDSDVQAVVSDYWYQTAKAEQRRELALIEKADDAMRVATDSVVTLSELEIQCIQAAQKVSDAKYNSEKSEGEK